jgi:DNA-binding PadR family transcriptional regulator
MEIKTTTAEALLGMLSMCPMTGYELRQRIEGSIGNFWSESYGQIYPTLKRLEQEGFVSMAEGERAGSKVYALTDEGWARLRAWLGVMPRPQVERNELLLKLFFGRLQPVDQVREQVAERRRGEVADLARYEAIERRLAREHATNPALPFWRMTLRYGMAQTKSLIGWCDETLAVLDEMARQNGSAGQEVETELAEVV